ncbi:MAG: hypothetical protein V2A73_13190, partial [Pseudomonadota bacterium]
MDSHGHWDSGGPQRQVGETGSDLLESYFTPGIALAPDNNIYMAVVETALPHRYLKFYQRDKNSVGAWQEVTDLGELDTELGMGGIPPMLPLDMRQRVTLLFLPYRGTCESVFVDGSGFLAAFWNSGNPWGDDDSWHVLRAYTTGYVSPSGTNWELAAGIGPPAGLRRFTESSAVQRAFPRHSIHAVRRLNDAALIYTGGTW